MSAIIPAFNSLSRLVSDWKAAACVESVVGSGLPRTGKIALVLAPNRVVLVSQDGEVVLTIYYDAVIRVREVEFKALVFERDGVLVAPNETFGIEVDYNIGRKFERSFKLYVGSASNARALTDVLSEAVGSYLPTLDRNPIVLRSEGE